MLETSFTLINTFTSFMWDICWDACKSALKWYRNWPVCTKDKWLNGFLQKVIQYKSYWKSIWWFWVVSCVQKKLLSRLLRWMACKVVNNLLKGPRMWVSHKLYNLFIDNWEYSELHHLTCIVFTHSFDEVHYENC